MFENYTKELEILRPSKGVRDRPALWTNFEDKDYSHLIRIPTVGFEDWPVISKQRNIEDKAVWSNPNLKIEVFQKSFLLNRKLVFIYKTIQESKSLLNLKEDWDVEGALTCKKNTYSSAIEFLVKYSNEIFVSHNLVIEPPEINLTKDGSIDLEWRNDNYILLINFLNSEKLDIHYYGEDSKTKTIIKGFIDYNSINKDLAFWMQKLN